MEVFFDKIEYYRKQKKMTEKGFCELCKIGRTTYWSWKNQKHAPDEAKVRTIAKILEVSVNKISDLPREYDIADSVYNESIQNTASSWLNSLYENNSSSNITTIEKYLADIENDINNSFVVIKAIMQSIHEIFYIKDLNLKYVIVNEAFLNNLSLKKNYNVVGQSDIDFFQEKDAKVNENEDREILLTGKTIVNKEKLIPGSKKKKWGMVSKYPILSQGGKAIGIVAMITDITEQKIDNEKRIILQSAIDHLDDTYVSIGRWKDKNDYVYEYVNTTMKQLFSIEKPEEYKNLPKLWAGILTEKSLKIFKKRRQTKHFPAHFLYEGIKTDGDKIWVQDSVYKFGDRRISIVRDITEMKEAEEKRIALENGLNKLEDCIWIGTNENSSNCRWKLIFISNSISRFSGIPKEKFYEDPDIWLKCVEETNAGFIENFLDYELYPCEIEYSVINQITKKKSLINETIYRYGNTFLGFIKDIGEKREWEKLQEILNFYIEKTSFGVAVIDTNTLSFEYVNEQLANTFDLTINEIYRMEAGEWFLKYFQVDNGNRRVTIEEMKRMGKENKVKIITKQNTEKYVHIKSEINIFNKRECLLLTVHLNS